VSEVNVGSLADLPVDQGIRIVDEGMAVAVFRVDDGVHAIADRCSHAEASLSEGEVFGNEVECPRHGAEFDFTTGRALTLPATKPVAVFATEIRDGDVFVEIPDVENGDE
jgi:3-phenylpropionate/trans-cinnamate dioxygenase ferredoxin subunit